MRDRSELEIDGLIYTLVRADGRLEPELDSFNSGVWLYVFNTHFDR